jgi:outer membrane protein
MARLTRAAAGLVFTAAFATHAFAQQPGASQPLRIAYINSAVILANTPGRPQAESLFVREMAVARGEVQRLQQSLDSAVQEYQRTQVVMTPQARQTRENDLRQMEQRTRQRAQELEERMQAREQELTAPIMQRITAVIEGVRAEFNYSLIFDVATGGPIVAADRALDISPLIIQRLQAGGAPQAPAGAAPAPAAADTAARRPAAPATPAGPRNRPRP